MAIQYMEYDTLSEAVTGGAQEETERAQEHSRLERFGGRALIVCIFLLPVFFIPSPLFPLPDTKGALFALAALFVSALWVIARLKDGQGFFPQTLVVFSLGTFAAVAAFSSLFSGAVSSSFFGQGVEAGTAMSVLAATLVVFLAPVLLRTKDQIFAGYLAFFASLFLVGLFHLLRLAFGPDFLSLGVMNGTTANTIGKWNDLGVFLGAAAVLSLITVETLALSRLFKTLSYAALAVSLFLLAVVNFAPVWFALGVFSLVFLVYLISFAPRGGAADANVGADADAPSVSPPRGRRLPLPSLFVLLVSVAFILAGNTLGNGIASYFRVAQIEARPSWKATFEVARQTLVSDPLFGSGPNQFVSQWLKYKPAGINETLFWNSDFNYGVGLVPTFLATTGVIGLAAWLVFFLSFCYAGFTTVLSEIADTFARYLITSSFLVALFLWIFSIVYIPSASVFALAAFFTGLFVASLAAERLVAIRRLSFIDNPRTGFVSVLLLIVLLIGTISLAYGVVERYAASVYFEKGVAAARNGNVSAAEGLVSRAAALSPSDRYYRTLTELRLAQMNTVLGSASSAASLDSVRSQFQTLFGSALDNARKAASFNPNNYENFLELGRLYEAIVPLAIPGAYESARQSYEEALRQNPHSPAIYLVMARLEVAKKDTTSAKEYIRKALQEKTNYTDAIFLLSQIEAAEGNVKNAISSAEAASVLAPADPLVFFQLGFLRYTDRDFRGAVSALERAVSLTSSYANAKYFLGLSYERLGRDAEAIQQFEDIEKTNPGNQEVELILRNLRAGRSPFSNAAPPIDDAPERRPALPVGSE